MEIRSHVELAPYTTLKVGGPADFFVTVTDVPELEEAVSFARDNGLQITVLGGGSNVLVRDEGVRGLVIQNRIGGVSFEDDCTLVAGAGEVFDDIVELTVSKHMWGLENLSAIPGLVGATPIQNIGAYGVEVKDRIAWVDAFNADTMRIKRFEPSECRFGYRDSFFKTPAGKRYIIVRVAYRLSSGGAPVLSYRDLAQSFQGPHQPSILDVRNAVIHIRSKKFPDWRVVGTAGSFFKNPIVSLGTYHELKEWYPNLPSYPISDTEVKIPLGWILDHVCGLRGYREGQTGTFEGQALVVVNYGHTAKDIELFAHMMYTCVKEKTGIDIEREVVVLE